MNGYTGTRLGHICSLCNDTSLGRDFLVHNLSKHFLKTFLHKKCRRLLGRHFQPRFRCPGAARIRGWENSPSQRQGIHDWPITAPLLDSFAKWTNHRTRIIHVRLRVALHYGLFTSGISFRHRRHKKWFITACFRLSNGRKVCQFSTMILMVRCDEFL